MKCLYRTAKCWDELVTEFVVGLVVRLFADVELCWGCFYCSVIRVEVACYLDLVERFDLPQVLAIKYCVTQSNLVLDRWAFLVIFCLCM